MGKLIYKLLDNFPVVAPIIAVVITGFSVAGGAELAPTLLQNLLVWCVGAQGIWGASGHLFMADRVAKGIGWPAGSPFQRELGFASLGFGIAGLMCSTYANPDFWLAVIIMYSTFMIGAGFGHIYETLKHKNHSKLNAGPILYTDIVVPLALIGLYWYVFAR